MSVEGTLGSLLQGVSQQPARIRVEGQVTEQVNFMSDVAQGLTSRPAAEEIRQLAGATAGMRMQTVQFKQERFTFGFDTNLLAVWDSLGERRDITPDAGTLAYIGKNMRFSVYGDKIFVLNRDKITAKSAGTSTYPFYTVIVTALGGAFSRTYKLVLTFPGGETREGVYTTPDGTSDGDAAKTSSEYIITQLKTSLEASLAAGGTTAAVVLRQGPVLAVKWGGPLKATVEDGDNGAILRVITQYADDTTDLPEYAPHGTIVKIVGDTSNADDYFLRFAVQEATDADVGLKFGTRGVWEEWFDPQQSFQFDLTTMPHSLVKSGSGFQLKQSAFLGRRVGDNKTNTQPSFVGRSIRDIGGFESRLCVVSGPAVIMSRTNEPLDFWKKSATALIASDPIDMQSTKEGSVTLDWIVPFDRDLILISDPGDSQFVVTGGGVTPENSSLVLTTTYEMNGAARPVTTGRTMIFPFKNGRYSGLKEFFTNDQVATNGADTLTEVQNKYILGSVTNMASSKNFNMLVVSSEDSPSTVYVYKYLWEGTNRVQSSWSTWELPGIVRHFYFENSVLYIILQVGNEHFLCSTNLNRVIDPEGWHVTLDRKKKYTVAGGKVTLQYPDAVIVQSDGCLDPGKAATVTSITDGTFGTKNYFLDPLLCPEGSTVYCGLSIRRSVKPTMPRVKDRNGNTVSTAQIVVREFKVHLDDSSDVASVMHSPYRQPYEFYPRRFPLDDEPLDPNKKLLMDYTLVVPWGENANYSELELFSEDVRPTTILEIEWLGQVTGTRRRV